MVEGPSWKHGTLQNFFESCLSLEKDHDAFAKIAGLLQWPEKAWRECTVKSLYKKETRKKMRMNIQIGDSKVDFVILDLGSDVNILKK